jgi:hypothetical protein
MVAGAESGWGRTEVINVSSYDPKERQRTGRSFSEHDVSALAKNGARGLIARAGKGGLLDDKCAAFLASADSVGMLPGIYYRTTKKVPILTQADQFASRALALAASRPWRAKSLLLCADFDAHSTLNQMLLFLDRVEARTGVAPVVYLENSDHLKAILSTADATTKLRLARHPYWLALYSGKRGGPDTLLKSYGVWPEWTLWQYGGVLWKNGRSVPKVYSGYSTYFGDIDRPLERNVFNGSATELAMFWSQHGLRL